ncbi:MAG: triose-phosphate isomerase [Candidatus Rhabdochlamydia sp.]
MINNKSIIAANWKMHKTADEIRQFFHAFLPLEEMNTSQIWIAPSSLYLQQTLELTKHSCIQIGAQNIAWEASGPFTGEISAHQVRDVGASFVIIGHSERRRIFHETASQIEKKIGMAMECDLQPLLCIGETLEEREAGLTDQVLTDQLSSALQLYPHFKGTVAYEPIWAIGTGRPANLEMIEQAHQKCRDLLKMLCHEGDRIPLLYGGSVTENNVKNFKNIKEVDGVLVGGASLEPLSLKAIIQGFTQ